MFLGGFSHSYSVRRGGRYSYSNLTRTAGEFLRRGRRGVGWSLVNCGDTRRGGAGVLCRPLVSREAAKPRREEGHEGLFF